MVRDAPRLVETTEPPVGQVQMDLFAQPPRRADAKVIADQEHSDRQFRIKGGAAPLAVEIRQMRANGAEINEP